MIALVVVIALQQDPLEQNFGKLAEAWKAVGETRQQAGLTDETIRAMGRLSSAMEAAGLFDPEAPLEARALKRLLVRRAERTMPAADTANALAARGFVLRSAYSVETVDPLDRFEKSVARQQELKTKGLDDEDNLLEVVVDQRKALKEMGVLADEMPQWIRRRIAKLVGAMAAGGACPAAEKATPEQEKRIQSLISQLADAELEKRDEAARELNKIGEPAVPFLREATKSADAEVRERAKKLLGVGVKLPDPQSRATPAGVRYAQALADFERAVKKDK